MTRNCALVGMMCLLIVTCIWLVVDHDVEAGAPAGKNPTNDAIRTFEGQRRTDPGMMSPDELVAFVKYLAMCQKWRRHEITADEMNRYLNWGKRNIRFRLFVPRTRCRLGDDLRICFVVSNTGDKHEVFFPLKMSHGSTRGNKVDGIRTHELLFQEQPLMAPYFYMIPPGDEVVIPTVLPAQPAGPYTAIIYLQTALFMELDAQIRGFERKTVVSEKVTFNIVELQEAG